MIYIYVICFVSTSLYSIFDYDRAIATAQQGDWDTACSGMTSLLVNEPDNAQLLYDTGVASYNKEDFDQADAYFKRVTELVHASKELQEQAYFNRGNTCVKKGELHKALQQYKKTLELNPDNEQARHNYERVKQMLEQQEQQDKQKQQDEPENNQSQDGSEGEQSHSESGSSDHDKQPNKKSEEQQQEQEKRQDKQDKQDKKDHDNQNQSSEEQNSTQQEEQKQRDNQRTDQDEQDKEGQQDRVPDKENAADYDAQWSKDNQSDKEPDDKQQNNSLNRSGEKEHNSSLDQQQAGSQDTSDNQDKNKAADEQEYGYPADYQSDENLKSWVAQVLQKREKEDSTLNKRMIKATVSEKLSGRDEKHCW